MFNAAVALGVDVKAITGLVTSVQFCLSKVSKIPSKLYYVWYSDALHEASQDLMGGLHALSGFSRPLRHVLSCWPRNSAAAASGRQCALLL